MTFFRRVRRFAKSRSLAQLVTGRAQAAQEPVHERAAATSRMVVLASLNMDLVVALPHLPRPAETFAGERTQTNPDGKGASQGGRRHTPRRSGRHGRPG